MRRWIAVGLMCGFARAATAAPSPQMRAGFEKYRDEHLARAKFHVGGPTPKPEELIKGPPVKRRYSRDEVVACNYLPRRNKGSYAKFRCRLPEGGPELKVRIETKDRFTEVAGTRLLWALGFPADRMYPTQEVRCLGCPQNPQHGIGELADRSYALAAVERKFPGTKIDGERRGWSWEEAFQAPLPRQRRIEREALMLVMAFVNNRSNRAHQNRLVCPKNKLAEDGLCREPILMVHDMGSAFGGETQPPRRGGKGTLDLWAASPIWEDREQCVLALDLLEDLKIKPRITEAGRRFALARFRTLTRAHVRALFEAARFEQVDLELRRQLAAERPADEAAIDRMVIDRWIEAFFAKVRELQDAKCPR